MIVKIDFIYIESSIISNAACSIIAAAATPPITRAWKSPAQITYPEISSQVLSHDSGTIEDPVTSMRVFDRNKKV